MAFNINLYAGTATDMNDLFTKMMNAFMTIFGYNGDDANAGGNTNGWEILNVSQNDYAILSKGTSGVDDLVYRITLNGSSIAIGGYQFYDRVNKVFSTYGINDQSFGIKTLENEIPTMQFWMYGNNDFMHIIWKGYGLATEAKAITPYIISFGKFIPTYNPAVTHLSQAVTQIDQGSDILIPVQDASIFEPNRYIIISSATTFEKVLVTEVSTAGNTITVANVSQFHSNLTDDNGNIISPVVLGEISKPYYIWKQTNTNSGSTNENSVMVFPRLSGSTLSITTDSVTANGGSGVKCNIFNEISTLAQYSALDMLNYDRYMFELYIYSSVEDEKGFLGKIPYIYLIGSADTNSESTIVNDNYYLYRIFKLYNFPESIAVRESFK